MDINRRMSQIDIAGADPVAGWVENVPVALLNGDREFLLGAGFHLAHLGLLMLRQIDEAFRLFQFPQRQPIISLTAHLLLAGVVRDHESQIVSQDP